MVYQRTDSPFIVAMLTMLRMLPITLFGAVIGALAERLERRIALVIVVLSMLSSSVILALLAWTGALAVWHVALAPYPVLAGTVLIITGFANSGFSIMQATLVYLSAPPEMRSRIFGVLSVCIGIGMIGFIHLGLLAGLIGASWAIVTTSVAGILAMLFTRRWWCAIAA